MQQYPQSPDMNAQGQPPVYHQDPNAPPAQYQQPMYTGQSQQPAHPPPGHFGGPGSPPPQQYPAGSPPPMQPQGAYMEAQHKGVQPGMPPQQPSGAQYQNATPIANLNRGPAPADCPACGQRAMTNTAFETGNTTQ